MLRQSFASSFINSRFLLFVPCFTSDKASGKKGFMLGARELPIIWGSSPKYWEWISLPQSRSPPFLSLSLSSFTTRNYTFGDQEFSHWRLVFSHQNPTVTNFNFGHIWSLKPGHWKYLVTKNVLVTKCLQLVTMFLVTVEVFWWVTILVTRKVVSHQWLTFGDQRKIWFFTLMLRRPNLLVTKSFQHLKKIHFLAIIVLNFCYYVACAL